MATIELMPAVILAGGRATRMGGGDKGLLPYAGGTILSAVIARVRPQVGALALNANGDPARFTGLGLPVLPDPLPGQPGPLAGVLAAMLWAADLGQNRVLTVPTDAPHLPADLTARLTASPGPVAMAADAEGRLHPTVALWPVVPAELRAFLDGGGRRVRAFAEMLGLNAVPFPPGDPAPFLNINRPTDLPAT